MPFFVLLQKIKGGLLFTSIIFHFVFAILIVVLFVAWLSLRKKTSLFSNALVPLLLKQTLDFPGSRSQLVRCLHLLEQELTLVFGCKVKIRVAFCEDLDRSLFLDPMIFLMLKNFQHTAPCFLWKTETKSVQELTDTLNAFSEKKSLSFEHSGKHGDQYWVVHVDK